jgi:hypothetical protein
MSVIKNNVNRKSVGNEEYKNLIRNRRTLISSFFITVLTGLAIEGSIEPLWIVLKEGLKSMDLLLGYIFFITTIRFFVGNQLHLYDFEKESDLNDFMWILDFLFILSEHILLIFVAKSCSIDISIESHANFFNFILLILLVDIFWISIQFITNVLWVSWKRKIPWPWFIINYLTILSFLVITKYFICYSRIGLISCAIIFTIAAIADLYYVDYCNLLR